MRSLRILLLAIVVLVGVSAVFGRRVSIGAVGALEATPKLSKPSIVAPSASTASKPTKFASQLAGHYWYLDRDKKVPHLPATLECVGACQSPVPKYKATFTGISGIVFGVLDFSSNYVGFGQGPAPTIIGGCKDNNFTVILENERSVSNIFAAYSPCGTKFEGGTSIYTKNEGGFFASLKRDLMNDVRIWEQVPAAVTGKYTLLDRNVASTAEPLSITCTKDCTTKTPTYQGKYASTSFTVKFAPDGYAGFGTLDLQKGGSFCGRTQFTLIVPPKGLADGAAFLAAAKPNAACDFAGQAIRIEKA